MGFIETEIYEILNDSKKIKRLFLIERKRRKAKRNKPIFIGTLNIANYKWCSIKSILKSTERELMFFTIYLHDRLIYSYRLNLIKKFPKKDSEILEIGDDITFKDIEKILNEEKLNFKNQKNRISIASETIVNKGKKLALINPNLSPFQKQIFEEIAKSEGAKVISIEEAPGITRGEILEDSLAEKYPTIRWNFKWNEYSIIAAPDGITDDFVYEFKTTKNRFLSNFIKPVALAQADLYGYSFKRKKKKVQIYIMEESKRETWEAEIDENNVLGLLEKFSMANEFHKFFPPKEWKCKVCEYFNKCPFYKKSWQF
ncbi:MAG TPA: hypothetical protein ENO29_06945 [Candidatus Aminicenantes bacterium]|nr:MAG: hypothetical protein C0168_01570 [Candidatus Aminicenantes bacterium]HEK86074.1 hypothetical protein [Candidatus Aminicenantes bacterium]